jgi:hypothetical protein
MEKNRRSSGPVIWSDKTSKLLPATARQARGVFRTLRVTRFFSRAWLRSFGHVSDRDTTVFPPSQALSFSSEACHFINDSLFLTAV